jgi:hypothetical protein
MVEILLPAVLDTRAFDRGAVSASARKRSSSCNRAMTAMGQNRSFHHIVRTAEGRLIQVAPLSEGPR